MYLLPDLDLMKIRHTIHQDNYNALVLALALALVEEAHEPAAKVSSSKASSSKAGSSKAAPKAPKAKKTPPPAQGGARSATSRSRASHTSGYSISSMYPLSCVS